jgi:mRNA interferase RelE/StbE
MAYQVNFDPRASRQFRKLPAKMQQPVRSAIEGLATTPRPHGVTKLSQTRQPDLYRIEVQNYRVIYQIRDQLLVVLIVEVRKRNERTYRDL